MFIIFLIPCVVLGMQVLVASPVRAGDAVGSFGVLASHQLHVVEQSGLAAHLEGHHAPADVELRAVLRVRDVSVGPGAFGGACLRRGGYGGVGGGETGRLSVGGALGKVGVVAAHHGPGVLLAGWTRLEVGHAPGAVEVLGAVVGVRVERLGGGASRGAGAGRRGGMRCLSRTWFLGGGDDPALLLWVGGAPGLGRVVAVVAGGGEFKTRRTVLEEGGSVRALVETVAVLRVREEVTATATVRSTEISSTCKLYKAG